MTKYYRTREGESTAIDTKNQLTTCGSEPAPGPLLVPGGAKKLAGIIVAASSNFGAVGSANALIRLEGPGLPNGPETMIVAGVGVTIATGGQAVMKAQYYPIDADVTVANEILIFGEMTGADVGQISYGVTVVFSA